MTKPRVEWSYCCQSGTYYACIGEHGRVARFERLYTAEYWVNTGTYYREKQFGTRRNSLKAALADLKKFEAAEAVA